MDSVFHSFFSIPISFTCVYENIFITNRHRHTIRHCLRQCNPAACAVSGTYILYSYVYSCANPFKKQWIIQKTNTQMHFHDTISFVSIYECHVYMNLEKSRWCLTKIQSTACHPLNQIEKMKLFLAFFFVLFLAIIVVRIRFLNRRQLYHTIVARDIILFLFSLNDTMQSIIKY